MGLSTLSGWGSSFSNVLSVADAMILAPQVNGCILVIEAGKTKRNMLVQAVTRLHSANIHLYGCAMNRSQPGRRGYYYQYNNYADDKQDDGKKNGAARLPQWLSSLSKH